MFLDELQTTHRFVPGVHLCSSMAHVRLHCFMGICLPICTHILGSHGCANMHVYM